MNSFDVDSFNDNEIECNRSENQFHEETNRINNIHINHVFSDEEFKMPDRFVHELDALEKKSLVSENMSRMSLLRKFDPLVDTFDSNNDSMLKTNNLSLNESRNRLEAINQSLTTNMSNIISNQNQSFGDLTQNESTTLMNFNSPIIVDNQYSRADTLTPRNTNGNDLLLRNETQNSDKLFNDFQTKELLFHEKLIEKDRQIHYLEENLNSNQTKCQRYEFLLNLLHNLNEQIVEMSSEMIDNLVVDKNELIDKCSEMSAERVQALEEVNNVEKNFYEIHNRYDKVRTALEESKQREIQFNEEYMELMDKLKEKEQMYELLKSKAEQKIEDANNYIESARRECESELIAVKAQLKRSEMKINGLQAQLDQKTIENDELTKMVDELIANVEK